jgi:hypothetical protein
VKHTERRSSRDVLYENAASSAVLIGPSGAYRAIVPWSHHLSGQRGAHEQQ